MPVAKKSSDTSRAEVTEMPKSAKSGASTRAIRNGWWPSDNANDWRRSSDRSRHASLCANVIETAPRVEITVEGEQESGNGEPDETDEREHVVRARIGVRG